MSALDTKITKIEQELTSDRTRIKQLCRKALTSTNAVLGLPDAALLSWARTGLKQTDQVFRLLTRFHKNYLYIEDLYAKRDTEERGKILASVDKLLKENDKHYVKITNLLSKTILQAYEANIPDLDDHLALLDAKLCRDCTSNIKSLQAIKGLLIDEKTKKST